MPPINQGSTEYKNQPPQDQLTLDQPQPQPQKKKRGKIFWNSIIMININKGLAALAIAGVSALAFSGCNAATIAEDVVPIAPESTAQHEDAPPFEEEGEPMDEMDKVAVAGKESYKFEDGMSISIGNLRKAKVPQGYDHPGEPAVRFDVRVTNGTEFRMDAGSVDVNLVYGPDGRNAESLLSDGDDYGFEGSISKGRSKTVGYTFEVPAKHQDEIIIEVTPDYDRTPAVFTASI